MERPTGQNLTEGNGRADRQRAAGNEETGRAILRNTLATTLTLQSVSGSLRR
jgi:hypothetical protein